MEQFTYNQLKNLESREDMLECGISRLGTQSGNFGPFTEQARIVTKSGRDQMVKEVEYLADILGHDVSAIYEVAPTLKELLD